MVKMLIPMLALAVFPAGAASLSEDERAGLRFLDFVTAPMSEADEKGWWDTKYWTQGFDFAWNANKVVHYDVKKLGHGDWAADSRRWERWALDHYQSPLFGGGTLNLVYHVPTGLFYPRKPTERTWPLGHAPQAEY